MKRFFVSKRLDLFVYINAESKEDALHVAAEMDDRAFNVDTVEWDVGECDQEDDAR